jgi:hypothetical protein
MKDMVFLLWDKATFEVTGCCSLGAEDKDATGNEEVVNELIEGRRN